MRNLDVDSVKGTKSELCASCGGRNSPDARACEFCARVLSRTATAPVTRSFRWWLLLALSIVLLGALLLRLIVVLAVR